ncbi:MAG: dependent ligase [Fibrobacteres bacterium]|nr:dependent ligase [Fibrobacterota bacterium]
MARSSLATYKKKRDFQATPEPPPEIGKDWRPASGKAAARGGRFVVHEHHASRLHFDLRLEMGGVLKSYAVPKGPSLDPKDRRLAVNTEDHPVKYLTFQGSIGDGQYGAGQMVIWDTGTYTVTPGEDPLDQYAKGRLHLEFKGEKLKGGFMLIRTARDDRQWLFFKKKDEAAEADWQPALILPYGARAERPAGFEIPKEALRNASTRRAALAKASATPGAKAASTKATGTKASRSKASSSKDSSSKDFKAGEVKAVKAAKASSAGKTDGKSWPAGARKSPLPDFIEPMLATLADKPFDDPKWVFETKWDGWRALMRKDASGLHLISRSAKSLDAMFPELLDTGGLIKAESCMLDGEIVALDAEGVPRFQLLQNRLKGKGRLKAGRKAGSGSEEGRMVFYAFDVPFCGGMDLTACRLIDRKAVLARILPAPKRGKDPGPLRGSAHFEGSGIRIFEEAVRLGFEGVVAKLKDGPYRKGRSADWLKVKGHLRQEVVIGGYTEPRGSRTLFGSLVAGLYQGGEFVFAGHVGGGFNARLLKEVNGFMEPLRIKASPFDKTPKTN